MKIFLLPFCAIFFLRIGCGGPRDLPQKIDQLIKGKIAYEIPAAMNIDSSYRAIVTITKAQNNAILFSGLDSTGFYKDSIKISSRVKVSLIDPSGDKSFRIVALNTEEQLVDDSTNTVWQWNVAPLRSGNNEIILRVTAKVIDRIGENYRDIQVYNRSIQIQASFFSKVKQFWLDYWQWIITACMIPIIRSIYNKIFAKKKREAKE